MRKIFDKLISRGIDPVVAWQIVTQLFPENDAESRMLHAVAVELALDQPESLAEIH